MPRKNELLAAQIGAAIRAFRSETCPSCDDQKVRRTDPFCLQCLERLPIGFRDALRDTSRFIELFHPAMEFLRNAGAPASKLNLLG